MFWLIFGLILAIILVKVAYAVIPNRWLDSRIVPPGFFSDGLITWGTMLTSRQHIARGLELRGLPDMATADDKSLDALYDANMRLIAMVPPGDAVQIHFTVEDDYDGPLARYEEITRKAAEQGAPPWTLMHRAATSGQFRIMSQRGELARQKVFLYWCREVDAVKEMGGKTTLPNAKRWVAQQSKILGYQLESVARLYGCDPAGVMGDAEHCLHIRKWANPGQTARWGKGIDSVADMDPMKSIAHNVLFSDTPPFKTADDRIYLRMGGAYHTFFVISGRSRSTDMRKTRDLLDAVHHGIHICMTIRPLNSTTEVEAAQAEIKRLELQRSPKQGNVEAIDTQIIDLKARIRNISSGVSLPTETFWAIRIHGPTLEILNERVTSLRTALTAMDGLRYMEVNHPEAARRILSEMCPGWAGSEYRGNDIYWESANLCDLLPMSSTFTGWLDEADALLPGLRNSIIGVRLYDRAGTPLFSANIGRTGSGKTSDGINIVSQAAHRFHVRKKKDGPITGFSAIFDEGLAWHTTASMLGLKSIILREGATPTVNPFDTCGLPRTGALYSEICAIGMCLVGLSGAKDVDETRRGLIEEYARSMLDGRAEDWLEANPARERELARELCAVLAMKTGVLREESDLADAYVAFTNLSDPERQKYLGVVTDAQVAELIMEPTARVMLRDYVFTRLKPKDLPQWHQLGAKMTHGRLVHHTSSDVSERLREELDLLAGRIKRGNAGGVLGNFLDGVSTIEIGSPGIYVETSFLPKDSMLRELGPLVILGRVRRFILTRPRSECKMVYFEEFAKLCEIPGFENVTRENLAQFRKYGVWFNTSFQAPSQVDKINPSLTNLILGQSSQFWLHCMPSPDDVHRTGDSIGLPDPARREIMGYKMLQDQPAGNKATYMQLFANTGNGTVATGTARITAHQYLLYVVSSNGETFDKRQEVLRTYPTAFEGVLAEVDAEQRAKKEKAAA
jgi:hypothetical protein